MVCAGIVYAAVCGRRRFIAGIDQAFWDHQRAGEPIPAASPQGTPHWCPPILRPAMLAQLQHHHCHINQWDCQLLLKRTRDLLSSMFSTLPIACHLAAVRGGNKDACHGICSCMPLCCSLSLKMLGLDTPCWQRTQLHECPSLAASRQVFLVTRTEPHRLAVPGPAALDTGQQVP